MGKETIAYIGLGSNLGDRAGFIGAAVGQLGEVAGVEVLRVSDVVETAALGDGGQPNYLNAVAEVKTVLSAEGLFRETAGIEDSLGRKREGRWSARTIDLDILLFGDEIIESSDLTVPHGQMHLRGFVLGGLCQLDGRLRHPVLGETLYVLAERVGGKNFAYELGRPQVVSVAGIIGAGKTTLVKKLSEMIGCEMLFEPYDENPFLAQVYAGKDELALDSQLYFLVGRAGQLRAEALEAGRIYATDYIFEKELIYARRLLNEEQLSLYERIYEVFSVGVVRPCVVVYLYGGAKDCLGRIHKRNRPYEQGIGEEFLEALGGDYERLFASWDRCPVIRVAAMELDYNKEAEIEHLAGQIRSYILEVAP